MCVFFFLFFCFFFFCLRRLRELFVAHDKSSFARVKESDGTLIERFHALFGPLPVHFLIAYFLQLQFDDHRRHHVDQV